MGYDKNNLESKAKTYCRLRGLILTRELGFGTQGVVYKTSRNTALKVYDLADGFNREIDVYFRLQERRITHIRGMSVPRIMDFDADLLAFEMSIVRVPCVLDFGGAYLDEKPDHMSRDESWFSSKAFEFGENWDEAQAVIRELEYRGDLWLADVNTGNIKFRSS